jgi:hypothetical protein
VRWLLVLALTGCATQGIPDRIDIPVAVSCLPAVMPVRPQVFTDAELGAMGDFHIVIALRQNAVRLGDYASELEAVLVACK